MGHVPITRAPSFKHIYGLVGAWPLLHLHVGVLTFKALMPGGKGGGGGGLLRIFVGGVWHGFPNSDPISDQDM